MPTRTNLHILFLGKAGDATCQAALAFLLQTGHEVTYYEGVWGERLPDRVHGWHGDLIISFLSRWILPPAVIGNASLAAINFHPGPPEYPGFGCYNQALYEGSAHYGATCHHMDTVVDSGKIIATRRFAIGTAETVETLIGKTMKTMLELFLATVSDFLAGTGFPESTEKWTRPPFTKKDLERISEISLEMNKDEIDRRIQSTSYGKFQPYLRLHGHIFVLDRLPKTPASSMPEMSVTPPRNLPNIVTGSR